MSAAIPLSQLRDLYQTARSAANLDFSGQFGDVGGSGTQVSAFPERWLFVEVGENGAGTASTGDMPEFFYSWTPVSTVHLFALGDILGTDPLTDFFADMDGGDTFLFNKVPLIEVNGNPSVSEGTRVLAWVSDTGDSLLFDSQGGDGVDVTYTNSSTINITNSSTLNVDNSTVNYNTTTVNIDDSDIIIDNSTVTYGGDTTIVIEGPTYFAFGTEPSFSANQTNLTLTNTNTRQRIASDAHYRELRSIAPGASPSGRLLCLHNVGVYVILIAHEDSGSTAANRITTSTGNYYWLAPNHEVTLVYDNTTSRWRVSENSDERLHGIGTDYALTADVADLALDRDKLQHRITPDTAGWTISGFAGGIPGLKFHLINGSDADSFTLLHNDVTSSAANRLFLPNGDDVEIAPRAACVIEYDGNDDRWRIHFTPQPGSGGTPALTATYVGYGSGANLLTGTFDMTRLDIGTLGLERVAPDASTCPGVETFHSRSGTVDSDTNDAIAYWRANAYLSGIRPMGDAIWRYVGSGSQDGGQFEVWTTDSLSAMNLGLKIDDSADMYIGNADTATRLLGTGASGEVVNITLGTGLTRSTNTLNATPYDLLSDLTAAEISVTSNTTATISRMHALDGSGCTLTLPAVSGNTGRLLGIRVAVAATGLMTIDGNSTELIDGEQTRIMWAGESAILLCDGSRWAKIAGKTIPMIGKAANDKSLGSYDSISHATVTVVPFDRTDADNTGLMVDLANDRITCRRSGDYQSSGFVQFCGTASFGGLTATGTRFFSSFPGAQPELPAVSGSVPAVGSSTAITLTAGSNYQLTAFQDTGATQYIAAGVSNLALVEIPSW